MTNMMNGVAATRGCYGAMKFCQPLPRTVERVVQAVKDVAVNAHLSLRELKNCVNKLREKKISGYKQRMAVNPCGVYR
jgi:hypothetical protein